MYQLIGLREKLQENPIEIMGKSTVSGQDFPWSQPIECKIRELNVKQIHNYMECFEKKSQLFFTSNMQSIVVYTSGQVLIYHVHVSWMEHTNKK